VPVNPDEPEGPAGGRVFAGLRFGEQRFCKKASKSMMLFLGNNTHTANDNWAIIPIVMLWQTA
jgi:hypothetical protein